MLRRTRFVDHVDGLVRQFAVVDVTRGQFHSRLDGVGGVFHAVVLFKVGLQTFEDLDRIFDRRLVHVDFLETTRQRAILFKVLAELFVSRRTHAAQLAALQRRFQQVGRVHCATRGRASANDRVDFVDEQNRILVVLHLGHHGFQALFEVAAVAGAGQQCAHVEAIDRGLSQNLWHFFHDDLVGKAFGDSRFAHAGIAHQKRVVFTAAA